MGDNVQYSWNFGAYGNPATATGPGPHLVYFKVPENVAVSTSTVSLSTDLDGCIGLDSEVMNIRPHLSITSIATTDPTTCNSFNADGIIDVTVNNLNNADFQISINGGDSWRNTNQTYFTSLRNDNYDIWIRYDNGGLSNKLWRGNPFRT